MFEGERRDLRKIKVCIGFSHFLLSLHLISQAPGNFINPSFLILFFCINHNSIELFLGKFSQSKDFEDLRLLGSVN